jgi:hypothetical protein
VLAFSKAIDIETTWVPEVVMPRQTFREVLWLIAELRPKLAFASG